ncbi:MAG: outer membrane protein assembly factor BamC [Methylococcaceae bacterium]|jgi:outer membrane protein assembly factor BamC
MNIKTGLLIIAATVLLNVSGCSYVKTLFPDKEKDYQYTTEIPPLILPEDLKKSHIPSLTTATPAVPPLITDAAATVPVTAVNATAEETTAPAANESPVSASTTETEPAIPNIIITIERVKATEAENRLRINVPFINAWRMVNKALSRKAIEVTERNQEAKQITVQYDPDEQAPKDESFLDEVVFMFKGIQSNEQTYLLKLEENNQQTDITVTDKDNKLLSDAASVKLLTLLESTIKADLANK